MKKIYLLSSILMLMMAGCSSDKLDDFRDNAGTPTIAYEKIEVNQYMLNMTGILSGDGIKSIIEVGVCFNESEFGDPEHGNEKSRIKFSNIMTGNSFKLQTTLFPDREYKVRAYVINGSGTHYGAIETVTTTGFDFDLILPGKYKAVKHYSYRSITQAYEDYEVTIVKENGAFYLIGLGCKPLSLAPEKVKLEIEPSILDTDTGKVYKLNIPLQLTSAVDIDKNPVLFLGSKWFFDDLEDSQDVRAQLIVKNNIEIQIETGYGFAICDPLTHEIILGDQGEGVVDAIIGPQSYPTEKDEATEKLVPRPDCKLVKIIE